MHPPKLLSRIAGAALVASFPGLLPGASGMTRLFVAGSLLAAACWQARAAHPAGAFRPAAGPAPHEGRA
jgi:hypothetical protein